ncbi:hypothetical protein [Glycomyces rhizosphaerae]|uniref:YbaB/EbfC DNA-binding family protein n=1 Tax=Glycomyces rhizosphaerae TaxID=2054422 RepID=A0ABV7Q050_9ACTN
MTDTDPAPPAYTSGCGNVTIVDGGGPTPTVQLTTEAVRMPVRDLAELITHTARDAADAVRAAADSSPGSVTDALAQLKDLRDGLREDGLNAVIERNRARFGADDDLPPEDPRVQSRSALSSEYPTANLDMAIAMLERFQGAQGGQGPGDGSDEALGTATSPEGDVTVEATGEYPIARLLLGIHARELGPDALAKEINKTIALAAEDLSERQRAGIDAMGLPLTMDQVDGMPAEAQAYARKSIGQAAFLRQDHDEQIRRIRGQ